jgi:MtN3 and saliva related transmembrane protein
MESDAFGVTGWLHAHAEAIGFWAGMLTTSSFAPQLVRTWRTGGQGLSWGMVILFGWGVGLWLVYGLLVNSPPIIFANGLTELQIVLIAALKMRGRRSGAGR